MTTQVYGKTDEEIKEYHLKRLEQLSLSHIGDIPQLDDVSEEQDKWVKRRMAGPAWTWKTWDDSKI